MATAQDCSAFARARGELARTIAAMSRPPATSRKVGRVLVLLALFLVCLRATQTALALLGAGAFPRFYCGNMGTQLARRTQG